MDAKDFEDLVRRYQENRDFIQNEEAAKMALVIPFIRALGYDPGSPREVRPEFCAAFTQGDGKKLPDRMDYAIFDKSGQKCLMVIECKPLGADLKAKAQQLARYIAQLADLHFGIMTDGCHYLFFGDLDDKNIMDKEPFFVFSLDDNRTDWSKVAKFLTKFSREAFNAETLITDAENSRYRQTMIDRLANTLRSPLEDEVFTDWLTAGIMKGRRTPATKARLNELAREAVEPALLRFMGDDFVEKLKERIQQVRETPQQRLPDAPLPPTGMVMPTALNVSDDKKGVETTQEELDVFNMVRDLVVAEGILPADLMFRDTTNYFNVSYKKPTKWFVRFFSGGRRRSITTLVPVEEAKAMAPTFEVEESPATFGASRIYLEGTHQLPSLKELLLKSLQSVPFGRED